MKIDNPNIAINVDDQYVEHNIESLSPNQLAFGMGVAFGSHLATCERALGQQTSTIGILHLISELCSYAVDSYTMRMEVFANESEEEARKYE